MAREPKIKHGLLIHVSNFLNDFYPILWGYGGRVMDGEGRLVLGEPQNRELCRQALADLQNMQGSIIPAPETLKVFAKERSLRQSFYQGEALFMINWNTRTHDLRELISQCRDNSGRLSAQFQPGGGGPHPLPAGPCAPLFQHRLLRVGGEPLHRHPRPACGSLIWGENSSTW
jgi:ABC-type glycerol-3-phosphate transport system substrate-binding protein